MGSWGEGCSPRPSGAVLKTEGDNVHKYTWQVSGGKNLKTGEKHEGGKRPFKTAQLVKQLEPLPWLPGARGTEAGEALARGGLNLAAVLDNFSYKLC